MSENIGTENRVKDFKIACKLLIASDLSVSPIFHSRLSGRCEGNYPYLGLE
jgi:hypothetical protein